jgi:hypothetical protein
VRIDPPPPPLIGCEALTWRPVANEDPPSIPLSNEKPPQPPLPLPLLNLPMHVHARNSYE